MNRKMQHNLIADMPIWSIALIGLALVAVAGFLSLMVFVSVRASEGRTPSVAGPAIEPTQVLDPRVRVDPGTVEAGSLVVVAGEGWPVDDTIVIGLDSIAPGDPPSLELGSVVAAGMTSSTGTFTASFQYPSDAQWIGMEQAYVVARSSHQSDLTRWSQVRVVTPSPTALPPTAVPVITLTPAPPATSCSDKVEFVSDITIPDHTVIQAGKAFDKVWRLRNSGTCTWTNEYALVFVEGSPMGAPASAPLSGSVAPGSTVDLGVTLTAPTANGAYGAHFMLRNAAGTRFGLGSDAKGTFWARIQVGTTTGGPTTASGWNAEFFNNTGLSGTPALTRVDPKIDFDWGRSAPATGISADKFSARWTRKLDFDAGVYRFKLTTDDGARLYVDGILVIDSWKEDGVRELTAEVGLTKGSHTIKVEYFEQTREAVIRLSWSKRNTAEFSDWKAEYFNNRDLKGQPVLVRNNRSIDFDWSTKSPATGLPSDDFSVRWTRKINFEEGIYRFRAVSDDGIRVYVDGKLVINEWRDQAGKTTYAVDLELSGKKTIIVEYYEHLSSAKVHFWIERQVPATPTPTDVPPTEVPPTEIPPTEIPATEVPPTEIPGIAQ